MKQKLLVLFFFFATGCLSLSAQVAHSTPKLRVSASGGLGYLLKAGQDNIKGVINQDVIDKTNRDLRWGTHLDGDVHYLFPFGVGIGVKYLFQRRSTEVNDVTIDIYDGTHYVVSDIWERDYIQYAGPSLFGYIDIGNRDQIHLTSSLSGGYVWFRSEASLLAQNLLITSGNFAMNAEIGIDYLFHPNFGVGVNVGCLVGNIHKVKMTDGTVTQEQELNSNNYYNLSNVHLSVGIRYLLNK